ncbi:MAG: PrsW family glutamic-type intramembrane protease [Candidatus Paceibacterota bacterium]|jgi:RsiW-degrading membrane proteinase PrsW (M82 family)
MGLIIFALVLGLIPSFAWLLFFLKEDVHPEPKKLIASTFIFGLIAALFALFIEYTLAKSVKILQIENYGVISLLIMAGIEEIIKFIFVFLLVKSSLCNECEEPIDIMVYMITAALGFAAFENLAVTLNIVASPFNDLILNQMTGTIIFRFIGATLLHALASGVIGYWWATGVLRYRPKIFIINGLIIAVLLHTFFNYLILSFKDTIVYPTIFLSIIAFFTFLNFDQLRKKNP